MSGAGKRDGVQDEESNVTNILTSHIKKKEERANNRKYGAGSRKLKWVPAEGAETREIEALQRQKRL